MTAVEKSRDRLDSLAPFWQIWEVVVLRRVYRECNGTHTEAIPLAQIELPHRGEKAIREEARKLGLGGSRRTQKARRDMQETPPAAPLGKRPPRCSCCGGHMARENMDPPRFYCMACGQDDYRGV